MMEQPKGIRVMAVLHLVVVFTESFQSGRIWQP